LRAVAIGISTAMTTLTLMRAMSADPVPGKSARLFSAARCQYRAG